MLQQNKAPAVHIYMYLTITFLVLIGHSFEHRHCYFRRRVVYSVIQNTRNVYAYFDVIYFIIECFDLKFIKFHHNMSNITKIQKMILDAMFYAELKN